MTKREFLEKVIAESVSSELVEYATQQLEQLDIRNANRKSQVNSKKLAENQPILNGIIELVSDTPIPASELSKHLDVSTQKISALCRQLVEQGKLEKVEIKIPKVGKRMGYVKA